MRRFYTPQKDASIYEEYTTRQSGLDEILEVGKSGSGSYSIRSLLQFDISTISSSMSSGVIPPSASFDLKLYFARADKVKVGQYVELFPVSASWEEGQGYFYQEPYLENDGVTWQRRESGSLWTASGSDYLVSWAVSQSVAQPIEDMVFDVTDVVRTWITGSTANNGFLIKFPTVDELDGENEGRLYFFSRNTHTVFLPTIVAKWNDQTYSTTSMTASSWTDLTVYPNNLKPKYRENESVRVYLTVRQKSPLKTFSSTFAEWSNRYLPQTAYFSIEDVQSKEVIIPFDEYSFISVSGGQNYFDFKVEKMYPLRWYKVLVKVVDSAGREQIFDDHYQFMVTT